MSRRTSRRRSLTTQLTVLTTVISRPNPSMLVTDGGFKTVSGTHSLPEPVGPLKKLVTKVALSAEHGRLELSEPVESPRVGDKLEFIVGYSDSTVFLHDVMYATRGGTVAYTVRRTRPSRSKPRSVVVSIRCEIPSTLRRSSLNRWGPAPSSAMTPTLHLSPTRFSTSRAAMQPS